MCTIRNFTTLFPLFASATAHLTIMTLFHLIGHHMNQSIDYMRAAVSFAKRHVCPFIMSNFQNGSSGRSRGAASASPLPHNGTQFFRLCIRFRQKAPTSEVGVPPPPQQREILDLARIIARKTLLSSRLEKSLNVKEPLVFVPPIGHDAR